MGEWLLSRRDSAIESQGPANQQNGRVLKPRHSGFYASALEILWQGLGAKKLTITR
jgi:hypothetical protein